MIMFSDIEKENDDKTNEEDHGKHSSPFDEIRKQLNEILGPSGSKLGFAFPAVNVSKVDSQKSKEDEDKQTKSFIPLLSSPLSIFFLLMIQNGRLSIMKRLMKSC